MTSMSAAVSPAGGSYGHSVKLWAAFEWIPAFASFTKFLMLVCFLPDFELPQNEMKQQKLWEPLHVLLSAEFIVEPKTKAAFCRVFFSPSRRALPVPRLPLLFAGIVHSLLSHFLSIASRPAGAVSESRCLLPHCAPCQWEDSKTFMKQRV